MKQQGKFEDKETSLVDIVITAGKYIQHLWKKKWWVFGFLVAGAVIGTLIAHLRPVTFTARLTFMINEEESANTGGGLGFLLGQFGYGNRGPSYFNKDKVVELARSRRIIQEVLFREVELQTEKDLLINHLVKHYGLFGYEDGSIEAALFQPQNIDSAAYGKRKNFLTLYGKLLKGDAPERMLNVAYSPNSGIFSIRATTIRESLSVALAKMTYDVLSNFYIQEMTKKQRETYQILVAKTDSIRQALKNAEYRLAQIQDNSQGFLLRKDQLEKGRLERQIQMLGILYGEAIKNQETAAFVLKNITPVFQKIDEPLSPLRPNEASITAYAAVGGIIAGFLTIFWFLGRKMITENIEKL